MRAIVFGGAGFLGSSVADALTDRGHDVVVYDIKPSPYLRATQQAIVGDVLDQDRATDAAAGCEAVYNFAGIADLAEAQVDPVRTVRTNVLGNTILLEAARRAKAKRFLFASSLYVYSRAGAFYRSSKRACELVIEDYARAYGLEYTNLRYGSLYGPRADQSNWITNILHQAILERRIVRYGDGEELREYIHVLDAAESSVDVLEPEYANTNVIISGHQAVRVRDLLMMIGEMMGDIQIEYRSPATADPVPGSLHYQVTPYSFDANIARKLVRKSYLDLGQGLLDLMHRVHESTAPVR
jgi:UDP-glucose 4-epimerase